VADTPSPIEWSVSSRRRPGEDVNGDLGLVRVVGGGVLVAAVDGVGHGVEAARATRAAGAVLREDASRDLVGLAEQCHEALRSTRGAAISLAFVCARAGTMTWLGVGNVEGRVVGGDSPTKRPKGSLALQSGVAGHHLPRLTPATLPLVPGDLLLLATDGIAAAFADSLKTTGSTRAVGQRILSEHGRASDDALVVALRYLGPRT